MIRCFRGLAAPCLLSAVALSARAQVSPTMALTWGGYSGAVASNGYNGASASGRLGDRVEFSCYSNNGNVPMTLTVFDGAEGGPVLAQLSSATNILRIQTDGTPPGQSTVRCDANGLSIRDFHSTPVDPARSYVRSRHITDAAGNPLANGTLCFTPVDGFGHPAPFNIGGLANARPVPVCRTVANGAIPGAVLARSDQSRPLGIGYQTTITDAATGVKQVYGTLQVTGDIWDMSQAAPNVATAPPALWITGPAGPPGPPGPSGNGGATQAAGAPGSVQIAGPNGTFVALQYVPLNRGGDTMQGPLTLATDNPSGSQAASANYVNTRLSAAVQPNTNPSFTNVTLTNLLSVPCLGADSTGTLIPCPGGGGSGSGTPSTSTKQIAAQLNLENTSGNPGTWTPCSQGTCGGGASGSNSVTFANTSPAFAQNTAGSMAYTVSGSSYNGLLYRQSPGQILGQGTTTTAGSLTVATALSQTANSVTVNVTATESGSTAYTGTRIYLDNAAVYDDTTQSTHPQSFPYTIPNLSGAHTVAAVGYDAAGNTANASSTLAFGLDLDHITDVKGMLAFYVPSSNTNIRALEFDVAPDLLNGDRKTYGKLYYPSIQYDSVSKRWRPWNMAANSWDANNTFAGPDVISATNVKHTVYLHATFDQAAHTYTYQDLTVDGSKVFANLGLTYNAGDYSLLGFPVTAAPQLNAQVQIDTNSGSAGATVYYADWMQYANGVQVNPSGAGGSGSFPSLLAYGGDPTGATDSTAALKAALAANPSGTVFLPTQPSGAAASYKISSPVTLNTNQQLLGSGPGAVTLACAMNSGPCLVSANPLVSTTPTQLAGFTLAGTGGANTIGLYLGGDPAGNWSPAGYFANFVNTDNLAIRSFGSGVQWGNNTWANNFTGTVLENNQTAFNAPSGLTNSGENIVLSGVTIANGGTPINNAGGFEFTLHGLRDDYNSSPITFIGGDFHVSGGHFEQTSGPFFQVPYGSPGLEIRDSAFLLQGTTGTDADILDLYPQTMTLVIDGVNVYSNHPVSQFAHLSGTVQGSIRNLSGGYNLGAVVSSGVAEPNLTVEGFNSVAPARVALGGGPAWTSGTGAPTGSCAAGSLYSNTAGTAGSSLYTCVGSTWTNVK